MPLFRIFDHLALALLAALLLFMPAAMGVVEPLTEQIFITLAGILLLLATASALQRAQPTSLSPAFLVIFLFVALALLQTFSLPAGILSLLSPHNITLRQSWAGDIPNAAQSLTHATLSFDPAATASTLRLLLGVIAVFASAWLLLNSPKRIRTLLMTIFLLGIASTLLALAQSFWGNGHIYWIGPEAWQPTAGSFRVHNHYSQFTTLSLGAGIALLLTPIKKQPATPPIPLAPLGLLRHFLVAGCSLLALGVFASFSRAGMLALLISAAFWTLIHLRRQGKFRWKPTLITAASILAVALLVDGLQHWHIMLRRLISLGSASTYADRFNILASLLPVWRMFWRTGTGLGSFQIIFAPFERGNNPNTASHAENEFAQVFTEMGLPGILLVAAFVLLVALSIRRLVPRDDLSYSVIGPGFALTAIFIHSFTDFAQHLPACACLTAIYAALILRDASRAKPRPVSPNLRYAGVILAAAIWGILLRDANTARQAFDADFASQDRLASANRRDWNIPQAYLQRMLDSSLSAHTLAPDDPHIACTRANILWQALRRQDEPAPAADAPTPAALAQNAAAEIDPTRLRVPSYGPLMLREGQILWYIGHDPRGKTLISRAPMVDPCEPMAWFAAGRIHAEAGELDEALACFLRVQPLSTEFDLDMEGLLIRAGRPDLRAKLITARDGIAR